MQECKTTDQMEHSKKSTLQLLQERMERLSWFCVYLNKKEIVYELVTCWIKKG
jgi:hypothetical protein